MLFTVDKKPKDPDFQIMSVQIFKSMHHEDLLLFSG